MKTLLTAAFIAAATSLATASGDDISPDVIFGSGNANGSFTIANGGGIELGLRAKVRYNASNAPENTFNYDGVDTYTMQAGSPNGAPAGAWAIGDNARWNFEWSVNTDVNGTTGNNLDDFNYQIAMFRVNADGNTISDALAFDMINGFNPATSAVQWDHSIGDNTTGNGGGVEIWNNQSDAALYADRIANNNVAQNSWNYGFFDGIGGTALEDWDFNALGSYIIRLTAYDKITGLEVVSESITVNVVPLPTAAWAGLAMLGAFAGVRTIRRR